MKTPNTKTVNNIFYVVIFLLVGSSVLFTYLNVVARRDYQMLAEISCEPSIEKCFIWECDPLDDATCPENPADRISYYKKISKKYSTILECEATVDKLGCMPELSCVTGETSCFYINCDPSNISADEKCSE